MFVRVDDKKRVMHLTPSYERQFRLYPPMAIRQLMRDEICEFKRIVWNMTVPGRNFVVIVQTF